MICLKINNRSRHSRPDFSATNSIKKANDPSIPKPLLSPPCTELHLTFQYTKVVSTSLPEVELEVHLLFAKTTFSNSLTYSKLKNHDHGPDNPHSMLSDSFEQRLQQMQGGQYQSCTHFETTNDSTWINFAHLPWRLAC